MNLYLPNDAHRQASSEMKVAEYLFKRRISALFERFKEGQYSLSNFHFIHVIFNIKKIELISWQVDLVRTDLIRIDLVKGSQLV